MCPSGRELWKALLEKMHKECLDKMNTEMMLKKMAEVEVWL